MSNRTDTTLAELIARRDALKINCDSDIPDPRLSGEVEDVERRIGELEHRLRGVDSQHVALVERESVNIQSGISAS